MHRALEALAVADLDGCDRRGLEVVLDDWRTLRSFTDAVEVHIARRSKQLAAEGRSEPVEGVMAHGGRRSRRDAHAAAEREQACATMPAFEVALADGAVSGGHIDVLAAATHGLDAQARGTFAGHADELVALAECHTVEEFARECRDLARSVVADEGESRLAEQRRNCRARRWIDRATGMHHIHAELDPESGSKAWAAVNARADAIRRAQSVGPAQPGGGGIVGAHRRAAQAIVELLTGAQSVDRRVPEISVLIDWQTLAEGLHARSTCETTDGTVLPPSTVRRLCCAAEILPIVLNGDGEVLDQGRSQRPANRAQRRALQAMYHTCGHPSCEVPFDRCEIHHVHRWEHLGRTDLDNLIPLCGRHHHLVHEGGWVLHLGAHRVVTLIRPDGTTQFHGTTVNRTITTPAGHPPGRRRTAA